MPTTPFPTYAQVEYLRWSASSTEVIDVLLDSGSLTLTGVLFVGGMRARMRSWPAAVPPGSARLADMAGTDHRLGWRLRNLRPDPAAIESLADAWLAGTPARQAPSSR